MKLLKKISIKVLCLICISACTKNKNLSKLQWLCGKWQQINFEPNNTVFYEAWLQENENTLVGKGYWINEGDTSTMEKMKITSINNDVYYVVSLNNQNSGDEIKFRLTTNLNSDTLKFENQQHDFPKTITYIKKTESVFNAIIANEIKEFTLEMKRQY